MISSHTPSRSDWWAGVVATWFGAGRLRPAPGTWGSLAALPFAAVFAWLGGPGLVVAAAAALFVLGVTASERHALQLGRADPGEIVVDEVVGQWVTLACAPVSPIAYLAGFLLFRAFDIWKPWPIRLADRKVKGGFGIMLDDLLAGIGAFVVLQALVYVGVI